MNAAAIDAILGVVNILQQVINKSIQANEQANREQERINSILEEAGSTLQNLIVMMVRADRDPTEAEWKEVQNASAALHLRIQKLGKDI